MSQLIYKSGIQVPTITVGRIEEGQGKLSGAADRNDNGVVVVVDDNVDGEINKNAYNSAVLTPKALVGMKICFANRNSTVDVIPRSPEWSSVFPLYRDSFFPSASWADQYKYSLESEHVGQNNYSSENDTSNTADAVVKKKYTITFSLSNNKRMSFDVDVPLPIVVTSVNGNTIPTGIYAPIESGQSNNLLISSGPEQAPQWFNLGKNEQFLTSNAGTLAWQDIENTHITGQKLTIESDVDDPAIQPLAARGTVTLDFSPTTGYILTGYRFVNNLPGLEVVAQIDSFHMLITLKNTTDNSINLTDQLKIQESKFFPPFFNFGQENISILLKHLIDSIFAQNIQ